MSENVENVNAEVKVEKKGIRYETKSFWSGIGSVVKEHKMGKVLIGTALGVLGLAAVATGTVIGVKKIRGKADSVNAIPEDAKDVTPFTEE